VLLTARKEAEPVTGVVACMLVRGMYNKFRYYSR